MKKSQLISDLSLNKNGLSEEVLQLTNRILFMEAQLQNEKEKNSILAQQIESLQTIIKDCKC
jgi:peptidoglycan hydrolase CwlO-like protein